MSINLALKIKSEYSNKALSSGRKGISYVDKKKAGQTTGAPSFLFDVERHAKRNKFDVCHVIRGSMFNLFKYPQGLAFLRPGFHPGV